MRYYKLNPDHSVSAVLMTEWAKGFQHFNNRIVAKTELGAAPDKVEVSTVFLGLDHGYGEEGPPVLFETMVFGGPLHESQERYSTWNEAKAGHARWVKEVLTTMA